MISSEKDDSEWCLGEWVIYYCPSVMFYMRSLQPAITGCLWPVVPAFEILLLRNSPKPVEKHSRSGSSSNLSVNDIFHGPYSYLGIPAPRQMVLSCLKVPPQSRKKAVVICSHPMMLQDIKRPNPSQTGGCHHGSTKCGNKSIPKKYACFNRVTVKIIKTEREKVCN